MPSAPWRKESLKRGLYADAVGLYQSAMSGPLGGGDPALLKGMARAHCWRAIRKPPRNWFLKLKELDPKAFDTDSELDYARALEEQGKAEAAVAQYERRCAALFRRGSAGAFRLAAAEARPGRAGAGPVP